jgi:hypothetical protein
MYSNNKTATSKTILTMITATTPLIIIKTTTTTVKT